MSKCDICGKEGRVYCEDFNFCLFYCDNEECRKEAIKIMNDYLAILEVKDE